MLACLLGYLCRVTVRVQHCPPVSPYMSVSVSLSVPVRYNGIDLETQNHRPQHQWPAAASAAVMAAQPSYTMGQTIFL